MIKQISTSLLLFIFIIALYSTAQASVPTDAQIKKAVEESFKPFLKELEAMVNIDSATGNKDGVYKISMMIEKYMQNLGAKTEIYEEPKNSTAGRHVVARFKGTGKDKVLILVHFDTVPTTKNGTYKFRYDSKTGIGYGPGAGDSKASVVQVMQLMTIFKKLNYFPYKEVIIHFSSNEEGGSDLEQEIGVRLAKEVDYALVTDTGRPDFGIVTRRKTTGTYTVEITGKSGHAGNAPQASANAITELGYILTKLHALSSPMPGGKNHNPADYTTEASNKKGVKDRGQFIPDNSINTAVVSTTNTKSNVIPDNVKLLINIRCYSEAEHKKIEKALYDMAKNPVVGGVTVKVEGEMKYPPYGGTEGSKKMADLYKKVAKDKAGKTVTEWTAGGVTIANLTSLYAPTIDCIGVDADPLKEHTYHEEVDLKSYVPRQITMIHFLMELNKATK